jgi:putative thioredoxin
VKDTTTRTFVADVLEPSKQVPVLVDFWAPWCGPCRTLGPIIEKVVRESKGRVRLVKMNIDDHPEVSNQLGIQSIPAVVAFKDGQPLDGFVGALPESQVKAFIDRVAGPGGPSRADALLAAGGAALETGDASGAASAYAAVLQEESTHVGAIAGLARAFLLTGDLDRARQTLKMVPDAKKSDPAVAAALAQLNLAEQAGSLGDLRRLQAAAEAKPDDAQARYDLAVALGAAGRKEEAVDHLITIVRKARDWNEGAARAQLVRFFDAWGAADKATGYGRRKLSSVLFS